MKVLCAWCVNEGRSGDMGEKPPYDDRRVTHGMCLRCVAKWRDVIWSWRGGPLDLANLSARADPFGV